MRPKITVVGAGATGGSTARRIAARGYADVVLVDIIADFAAGKALDLNQAGSLVGYPPTIIGTGSYDDTVGSSVCVITSGFPRKPGMSRDDLLLGNQEIIEVVVKQLMDKSPDTTLIILTNPMDAMAQLALHVSGLPREKVIGQGGVLDTARYRTFIAWELGVSAEDVSGFVLGGHGDTMVPVPSYTSVAGIPVTELIELDRLNEIVQRARDGGAEVGGLMKVASAFEAPGEACAMMVESIMLDQKRIFPCAVQLKGEFGIDGTFVGVPVKLGSGGVEQIMPLKLSAAESSDLKKSAEAVVELVQIMGI